MTTQNGLLIFLGKETHFENKIMEIAEDFDEKSYSTNGEPWKSSRILRVKPNFFIFSLFIIFRHFSFFLMFFIFLIFHFSFFSLFFVFIFFIFSVFSFLFIFSFFHFFQFFCGTR